MITAWIRNQIAQKTSVVKSIFLPHLGRMGSIKRVTLRGKEILEVDFSNSKEDQMIEILMEARRILISENKKQLVLALFNERNYLTPKFMDRFRMDQREEAIKVIEKQAIVGFNETKKQIIKGYNVIFNRDMKMFDTLEEAINFLVS